MSVEQGCFEVDQTMLNAGFHEVTLSGTPDHVVATVRRGTSRPNMGIGQRMLDKPVEVTGTTVKFRMTQERVGNCICWTAYLP